MGRRAAGFERELRKIGDEVVRRRLLAGMTQPELAQAAGISLDGLLNVEKGRTSPQAVTLIQLARALRCRAADFLGVLDGSVDPARDGLDARLALQPPEVVLAATACVDAVLSVASVGREKKRRRS